MAARKGTRPPNAGKGRKKGVPNRATADVRATIALIAGRNVTLLQTWLERVGKRDPARAADLLLRMLEYHIPKLARTEMTGAAGGPVQQSLQVTFVPATPRERT